MFCNHCGKIHNDTNHCAVFSRRSFITRTGAAGIALATSGIWLSGCGTPITVPVPANATLQWEVVTPLGIHYHYNEVWQSGHVNAILELETPEKSLLVGTDSGGVWQVANDGSAATPLSNDWDVPDIRCLLVGPQGPQHIYAGGGLTIPQNRGAIYVTDPTGAHPLQSWHDISPIGSGRINRLIVIANPDRLVAASDSGLYWAAIPTTGFTYQWQQATGATGGCFGVAAGPNATVAASTESGKDNHNILIVGGWQGTTLVMAPATIAIANSSDFYNIAVASCAATPARMYATCGDIGGGFAAVLHSEDGGQHWNACGMVVQNVPPPLTLHDVATQAFNYANCVTVSPVDPNTVIVGGIAPCISQDGGTTWNVFIEGVAYDNHGLYYNSEARVHADQHAITFVPNHPNQVYLGHDGGVTKVLDIQAAAQSPLSTNYQTIYNQYLATMQFYDPSGMRSGWGTLGVSTQVEGLIGGGTQDNGNMVTIAGDPAQPWQVLEHGDGGLMMFARTGHLIHEIYVNYAMGVHETNWVGTGFDYGMPGFIPIQGGNPNSTVTVLNPNAMELVNDPTYLNALGKLTYAVASEGSDLYGLYDVTDYQSVHWRYLATVPDKSTITSLGAGSGKTVFIGTETSKVYVYSLATGVFQESHGLPKPDNLGAITKIIVQDEPEAFMILNIRYNQGYIYHTTDGQQWQKLGGGLPNELFYAMDTDWTQHPKPLFVSTDTLVYRSDDNGQTWSNQSSGLPRRPHGADIRFVLTPKNERYLYLSTYGRSVWRTLVK